MGWIGCVHCEKLWCDFRGTNFFINCTSSTHFIPSSVCNETLPNAPKHYEMLQNLSLVPMGWIECVLCEKFRCDFMAQTCALIAQFNPFCTEFHVVTKHWQMHPNTTKTHQNMSLRSNGLHRLHSLPKIPMRVHRTDFCINCTSSAYFASIFMQKWNNPICTQTLQNAPIHEFSIQWGGSGAFIAKNSDAISWHELLH